MVFIRVEQCLNGHWVELIELPVDKTDATKEEIFSGMEEFTDMISKADKASLSNADTIVVLQAAHGPIRFSIDENRQ